MFSKKRAAHLVCAMAAVLCLSTPAAANPPVEAFGNLPQFSDWRISPDGKHLAVIQPRDGKPVVFIYTVGAPAGTKPIAYGSGDGIVRELRWLSNDRLTFELTKNMHVINDRVTREWGVFVCIDTDGGHEFGIDGRIVGVDLGDPDHAYSVMQMETEAANTTGELTSTEKSALGLYQVGIKNPTTYPVEQGTNDTVQWVIDEHGKPVARIDRAADLSEDIFTKAGSDWSKVASFAYSHGEQEAYVAGELFDGQTLAVDRAHAGKPDTLERMDLSGATKETLFSDPTYDIDQPLIDEWTGKVVGVSYVADKEEYRYFDPSREALQRGLEQAFAGNSVAIASMNQAADRAVIEVDGPRQPPVYLFYDRTTKNASVIANAYPALTPADLGDVKPYVYKARDGLDIHGYLTLPPGVTSAKNMPMVVFPHGGPEARDRVRFDWWAQFMANRGYVVFQPNFRGSTGYGAAFHDAGDGQWGKGMVNDVTDGVKKLIADGVADPKRICIVGASYGGYAALAGATFTPDLYACAVSFAGVSDVQEIFGYSLRGAGNDKATREDMQRLTGAAFGDAAALDAISPAKHAADVRAPILLIHADKDVTVPINQSLEEQKALLAGGKNVQLVMIDGDDHYLSVSSSRIEVLKQIDAFLAAHLGH